VTNWFAVTVDVCPWVRDVGDALAVTATAWTAKLPKFAPETAPTPLLAA
jgi:hypothetical protein